MGLGICNGVIGCVNDGVRIIFGKGTQLKIQQSKCKCFHPKVDISQQKLLTNANAVFLLCGFHGVMLI